MAVYALFDSYDHRPTEQYRSRQVPPDETSSGAGKALHETSLQLPWISGIHPRASRPSQMSVAVSSPLPSCVVRGGIAVPNLANKEGHSDAVPRRFPLLSQGTLCTIAASIVTRLPDCVSTAAANSAAISTATRAGRVTQTSVLAGPADTPASPPGPNPPACLLVLDRQLAVLRLAVASAVRGHGADPFAVGADRSHPAEPPRRHRCLG